MLVLIFVMIYRRSLGLFVRIFILLNKVWRKEIFCIWLLLLWSLSFFLLVIWDLLEFWVVWNLFFLLIKYFLVLFKLKCLGFWSSGFFKLIFVFFNILVKWLLEVVFRLLLVFLIWMDWVRLKFWWEVDWEYSFMDCL